MSKGLRRTLGIALAVLVTLAIAALSRLPYATPGDHAVIRLSWRTPGEYVEECRRLTQEELERLPVHMRREEVCEGRMVPYRLSVLLEGSTVVEETVQPAGARRDRPLYVFRELPVAPGEYRLEVRWDPAESAATRAHVEEEEAEHHREEREEEHRRQASGPLALGATLRLEPGDIALVTYDPNRRMLAAMGRGVVESRIR